MTVMTPARAALVLAPASALILASILAAPPATAIGLDCTWTGAAADANWSTPGNWTDCAGSAPGASDTLIFPTGPAVVATSNDLFGTVFSSIRWEGTGYSVAGAPVETNAFTVAGATSLVADLIVHQSAGEHLDHVAADLTIEPGHGLTYAQDPGATAILTLYDGAIVDGRIGGPAEHLVVRGDGTLAPRGNQYAGAIAIEDDVTLRCGGTDCGPDAGPLTVDDAATLEFTADTGFPRPLVLGTSGALAPYSLIAGPHAVSLDAQVTVGADVRVQGGTGGSPLSFAGGLAVGDGTLGLDGAAEIPQFATLTSNPDGELIVGTEQGAGTLTIAEGQFGHLGRTSVSGAGSVLTAGDALALGPDGSAITTAVNGATIGTDDTITLDETIRIDATSRIATSAPTASLTVNDLELDGGGRVETLATPSAISLAGVSGTGPLHLASAGSDAPILFDLGGTSAYTGATVAETGVIALNRDDSVPGDLLVQAAHVTTRHTAHDELHDLIPDTATVTIDGGDVVVNDRERVGALAGAGGSLLLVDAASEFTVGGDATTSWAGDLRGGGGFAHQGIGSLELNGDWADLAAGSRLLVADGRVDVHGSFAQTDATVQGTLGGTGTLRGIALDGGVLAPGASPGCLAVIDELGGTGTVELELGGTEPCAFDQVDVDVQKLATAEWSIAFADGFVPVEGDQFTVVTTNGGAGNDAVPGQQFTVDGVTLELSWDGTDIALNVLEVLGSPDGSGEGPAGGPDGAGASSGDTAALASTGADPVFPLLIALVAFAGAAVAGALHRRRMRQSPKRAW
ncbi:hypothetical protein [Agromyces sp. H66]|uniref:hypothetical protein n=1 Tax=Agromyces sp. H66 TaxID=2529859 RepID=UPI0010AA3BBC|nr:hypothetical protein [Agromyces sp. H66]